jgi:hypothetical protein
MLPTTLLVIVIGVFAVLVVGLVLAGRSPARPSPAASGSARDTGWVPVMFSDSVCSDSGDADSSAGDAGGGSD